MFEMLLAAALREWPPALDMKVERFTHCYLVDGLLPLQTRIAQPWNGHALEVLMSNLHWAICMAAHQRFRHARIVRPARLDREVIRRKLEHDLALILRKPQSWTAADQRIIRSYFAAGRPLLRAPLGRA
jgi:hypothetical protein